MALLHALAMRRSHLGEDALDVATTTCALARVCTATGRHAEAEQLYRGALAVRQALLPDDCHPDLADSYNSIGVCMGRQRRYCEEEELYRRTLAIRKRVLGE